MSTQHTPGPWIADDNSWEVSTVYGPGGEIAKCCIDQNVTEETQDQLELVKQANARLIAAAPVMLAALRSMRCAIEAQILGAKAARHGPDVEVIDTFIEDCQDDLDLINDAITLATGEQA